MGRLQKLLEKAKDKLLTVRRQKPHVKVEYVKMAIEALEGENLDDPRT